MLFCYKNLGLFTHQIWRFLIIFFPGQTLKPSKTKVIKNFHITSCTNKNYFQNQLHFKRGNKKKEMKFHFRFRFDWSPTSKEDELYQGIDWLIWSTSKIKKKRNELSGSNLAERKMTEFNFSSNKIWLQVTFTCF